MNCPSCGAIDSKVVDSRSVEDGTSIRRRRECLDCGYRFTTYERLNEVPLIVLKQDKSAEPFDRNKLLRGLMIATAKRDVSVSRLNELINDVEQQLRTTNVNEVDSKVLGDMVLDHLRLIDDIAYIRFASVYKDFRDVDEFMAALAHMDEE
jgi:transcriptional repressor NrdR